MGSNEEYYDQQIVEISEACGHTRVVLIFGWETWDVRGIKPKNGTLWIYSLCTVDIIGNINVRKIRGCGRIIKLEKYHGKKPILKTWINSKRLDHSLSWIWVEKRSLNDQLLIRTMKIGSIAIGL